MKVFKVIRPGPYTTIQDIGRPGLRRYGIPSSGALDQFSYRSANLLLGNPGGNAALEITLGGLVLETLAPVQAAITGADLSAKVNDQPAPMWSTFELQTGDRLSFNNRINGCRAYLGVHGGFDEPDFMGSKSTFPKGRMGRPLKAEDVLSVGGFLLPLRVRRSVRPEFRPRFSSPCAIRVILGPQQDYFTQRGLETFLTSQYSLSPKSDRQGFRTEGPPIEIAKGPGIISDPTPLGAIQVPGDGKPIILMRDGQVTGGYAKIGIVIGCDLNRLGQVLPGEPFGFKSVGRDEALALAQRDEQQLSLIPAMIQ